MGFECSLDTSPLDALERQARAISPEWVRDSFECVDGTEEVTLLTTCHRVELVLLLRGGEDGLRWHEALPGPRDLWRVREGGDVVRHLFRVAAGRESLARGEGEVRHQVRLAGSRVISRHPRPVLRELLARASDAAEALASPSAVSPSIAAVAASRLLALVRRHEPTVLVIGSGTVGRQVVEGLGKNARVTVLFHRNPPDPAWLKESGARAAPMDRLKESLAQADAAVTAAKFGDRGLRAVDLPRDHPLLLFDLGMPRNIDPDVRELSNVQLVDLETLHATREPSLPPYGADERLDELADRCTERLARLLMEPWIGALRRSAEELRRGEFAAARPFLGRLEPAQEIAVERLTQRLVARLLQLPTERIRDLPAGPYGDLRRQWAIDLLRPRDPDP